MEREGTRREDSKRERNGQGMEKDGEGCEKVVEGRVTGSRRKGVGKEKVTRVRKGIGGMGQQRWRSGKKVEMNGSRRGRKKIGVGKVGR